MTGKRALTFPIGKVGIDGTVTTTGTVTLGAGTAAYGKLSANAGVNIGAVTVPLATAFFAGTKATVTAGTRVPLASTQALIYGVVVTAAVANTGFIYVAGSTVSSTVFMYRLSPGQSSPLIPIADLATVNIDSSVNAEGVTYCGL